MRIGRDIVRVHFLQSVGRILLHLVRTDIDGLNELPLKTTLGAEAGEIPLIRTDACHLTRARRSAAQRPGAGSPSLRVVDAEIGM